MASDGRKNLKSLKERTTEEQRKIASSGGVASVKKRREKKALKERLLLLMEAKRADKDGAEIEAADLMALSMINEAIDGNVSAFIAIRDSVGEKPTDKLNLAASVSQAEVQIYRIPDNGRD